MEKNSAVGRVLGGGNELQGGLRMNPIAVRVAAAEASRTAVEPKRDRAAIRRRNLRWRVSPSPVWD